MRTNISRPTSYPDLAEDIDQGGTFFVPDIAEPLIRLISHGGWVAAANLRTGETIDLARKAPACARELAVTEVGR